ncbi:hypothetical protein QYE76_001871 [Lolium multiflorum]|uniref:Bet v I/Major latex protein domain-containing protein n=1 Tax=Lolium multiflorum TaxID=4521 RepID=A0AAD8W033_LOLMU|nr:hypothetical protein QYE76_001871 [Lolium multiflorum]
MAAGCVITEECSLAVSADRMWKVTCSSDALLKACAGLIDAVNVEGDGGPGTVNTLTLSAAAAAASGGGLMKGRVVACDDAARVLRNEVLEGGRVKGQLKSLVNEVKLEAAGDGACVAKLTMEYERLDGGGALAPEDQAELVGGYLGMFKTVEAYLVANPAEYA